MMIALYGLAVFVAAVALDFADARNTMAVAAARAHDAARWSCAMALLGVVGLLGIVEISLWLIVPELAGLYLGSWLAVRRSRNSA